MAVKNKDLFFLIYDGKYAVLDHDVRKLGNEKYLDHSNYGIKEKQEIILDRSFTYEDYPNNEYYFAQEGFVLFDEDSQPDPKFVVDNIDNFHASDNIKTTIDKIKRKLSPKGYQEGDTIYILVEGKLYLFFKVYKNNLYQLKTDGGPW